MAKEVWTVEIEVEVEESEPGRYIIACLQGGGPSVKVLNTDDFILTAMPDGLHKHSYCICRNLLPWKLVDRKPA